MLELVPIKELEAKYRLALQLLIGIRHGAPLGDYLEFGVYNGTSLACMYRALKNLELDQVRLFGFDSFKGLPAKASADAGSWKPGDFKSELTNTVDQLNKQGIDWNRVHLIEGWFSDTLSLTTRSQYQLNQVGIIMIDCDIYSSAKEALTFCGPLIKNESIIFFDDWHADNLAARNEGEKKAFDEFLNENPHLRTKSLNELIYTPNAEVFMVYPKIK